MVDLWKSVRIWDKNLRNKSMNRMHLRISMCITKFNSQITTYKKLRQNLLRHIY